MILSPSGDGIFSIPPSGFGMSMSASGVPAAGEVIRFPDDNVTHTGVVAAFAFNVPTPRTSGYALFQTGHVNLWSSADVGTGAGSDASGSDDQHPTVGTWFTGTTTTGSISILPGIGQAYLFSSISHLLSIESVFMIPVLSNGTDAFNVRLGYANVVTGAVANGAYMEIDSNANAAMQFVTANVSTRTTVSSGITILAGIWYRALLRITNASQADFYLVPEGTALPNTPTASITTNLPSGAAKTMVPTKGIMKSAGTTLRKLSVLHVIAGVDRLAA